MALHFKDARSLDELPPEQRAILVEGAAENGIKISALSSFANLSGKDYVNYSEKQMAAYRRLNGPSESQKRIFML